MDSTDALVTSIATYKKQLDEISKALQTANKEQKPTLESLQLDLIQILELSLQQLEETQQAARNQKQNHSQQDKTLEQELALFNSEIAELENETQSQADDGQSFLASNESMLKQLQAVEGQHTRAPFTETWGGYTYSNAVILSAVLDEEGCVDLDDPKVLVLFSEPTSNAMLPCPFFMKGRCNFETEKCKFSHGSPVSLSDLKDYKATEIECLAVGEAVVAKHEGDLWHRGTVADTLPDLSAFSFQCETCNEVVVVQPNCIVAATHDLPTQTHSDSEQDDCPEEEQLPAAVASTSTPNSFAHWEQHTKGMGSKLMQLMGYVSGDGLGARSDGRIEPVTTLVYPQRMSLDGCMQLRLAGDGKKLLEVEKHMQKQQNKLKPQTQQLPVFQLLNDKIGTKSMKKDCKDEKKKVDISKMQLKKDLTKELNRKNLLLSTHIQAVQNDICKLKVSRERNVCDVTTLAVINQKLNDKRKQLVSLQQAENKITNEQQHRQDKKKSFIF